MPSVAYISNSDYLDQDEVVLENSAETESSPSGSDPYPGFDFAPATTGLYGPAGTGPQPSAHEVPATSSVTPEGHPTPPHQSVSWSILGNNDQLT